MKTFDPWPLAGLLPPGDDAPGRPRAPTPLSPPPRAALVAVAKEIEYYSMLAVCPAAFDDEICKAWYIKAHSKDVEFLNTPILDYQSMEAIFGGRFTMGSNEPPGVAADEQGIDLEAEGDPIHVADDIKPVETKPRGENAKQKKRKRVSHEGSTNDWLDRCYKGICCCCVGGCARAVPCCHGLPWFQQRVPDGGF